MSDKIKAKWLNETSDFIARLEKLEYEKVDGKTLISKEGYEVYYSIELMGNPPHRDDYPLQVVIHIRKNGQHVTMWGCDTNEANRLFVNFFIKAKANAYTVEHRNEGEARESNEKEFWAL